MSGLTFSDNVYNKLKWFVSIVMPAFTALYVGLAEIYGWANTDKVVGTLALVTTFLGVLLGFSTKNYNASDAPYDGQLVTEIDPTTGKVVYGLELNEVPENIPEKGSVTFKVVNT